jgi:hypothetical protein
MREFESFNQIWSVDFEFVSRDGEVPNPVVCMVAKELLSGETGKLWLVGGSPPQPPYSIEDDSLFVAYNAVAEMSCHLQLGWKIPCNILDLYVEFLNLKNGLPKPSGKSLLGALVYYGIPGITKDEKERMRNRILQGEPYSPIEQQEILDYCETDVIAGENLYYAMKDEIDLPRALLRGRYMSAVAQIERNGVPIDAEIYRRLIRNWDPMKSLLVKEVDRDFGVYEGLTFKVDLWDKWVQNHNIDWPVTEKEHLDLKYDTFKKMAKIHPEIRPIKDLRYILGQLRLKDLAVGKDARNRCSLFPFSSITGRNQPSSSHYIFGLASWIRSLIQPNPGTGLASIDYSQEEFGIAAALSRDYKMQEAYLSGDPYITFAKQAGAVPATATKESHPNERDLFKQCVLATQYGMSAKGLAHKIEQPVADAQHLLDLHKRTYETFWKWSDNVVDYATLHNRIWTRFGWYYHINDIVKPRTLQNFPMQANGAEILRIACCNAIENGVKVCAPVHDALLIEASIDELPHAIAVTQQVMAMASRIVLDGFELRTEVDSFVYPERYEKTSSKGMWQKMMTLLEHCEQSGGQ